MSLSFFFYIGAVELLEVCCHNVEWEVQSGGDSIQEERKEAADWE